MTEKDKDFLEGLAISAACHVLPARKVFREPIAYSYNGVILPKLPEWDREMYPYMCMTTNSSNSVVNLHMSSEPVVYDGKLNVTMIRTAYVPKPRLFVSWTENNNAWGEIAEGNTDYNIYYSNPLIWTNTDIIKSNGSVYLAASEPIPVYE